MAFSKGFQRIWWVVLLLLFSVLILKLWTPPWLIYSYEKDDYYNKLLIVWILLLLVPLFSEISFFGIGIKRDVRDLRESVENQSKANRVYWLGNDLASLRFQVFLKIDSDEKKKLIEWQFAQALEHARAANIPKTEFEKLNEIRTKYMESDNTNRDEIIAREIFEIQQSLGSMFDASCESTE